MAIGKDGAVGRQLRTLFNIGAIRELTDGQLLERFATGRGEAAELAFAALVERHGPMVLRVCRGVLDDPHDSQDAFQATFLVLVAKVRALWVRDSLGPWLHQVAYRTASCARANAARRRRLEARAAKGVEGRPEVVDDLGRVLHEEIDRLPERFRAPVVLCDLEGRTHEQAARHLGWPVGTVKSRQARARERLRDRLTRRGYAPGFGLLAASPKPDANLPLALVDSTTTAAIRFVATRALVPGSAAALAQGVIRSMIVIRWLKAASVLLALGAVGSGVGLLAQDPKGEPGEVPKPEPKAEAGQNADRSVVPVKPGKLRVTVSERGIVEPSRPMDVLCQVQGGTTIIMIKPEGSHVQKGEVVAELDSAALRDALVNQQITIQQSEYAHKQATLVREVAEYAVKEYVEGIYPRERESLSGKIADAQSGIPKDKARLARTQRARKRFDESLAPSKEPATPSDIVGDLSIDAQFDDAELGLSRRKRDLELAQTDLNVLQRYTREKTIKKLTIELEQAKGDELSKEARWGLERTKEKKLERQIEMCTLKAPGDGYIVYANYPGRVGGPNRVQIEEGASVRERQLIFKVIADDDPMRVNVKVPEALVGLIKPGQTVRVKVDAFKGTELTGVVRAVAPFADALPISSREDERVCTTFIKLEKGLPGLRPGLSAQAEILVTELDNVIRVPIPWVFVSDDKAHVVLKTPEGRIEWREVTLGVSNGQIVEVKDGLKPGEFLVREPGDQMGLDMRGKVRLNKSWRSPAPGSAR